MIRNIKSYFKFLRIRDATGYFLIVALGFILARGFLFPAKNIFLFWLISFLLLGFGFSINNCFDQKEDQLDQTKKNPIVLKEISFKKGFIFSILTGLIGLYLSSLFGLKIFLFSLISTLIVFFYSSPPLRLKSRPLFDLISHGFFAGPLIFFFPLLVFKIKVTLFHWLISFSLFCFSVILELRNFLEEYETDKKAGVKNSVCFLGFEKSEKLLRYLAIFYPLTIFPGFLLSLPQYLYLFFVFSLIFLFSFLFFENSRVVKNYRIIDIYAFFSFSFLAILTIF